MDRSAELANRTTESYLVSQTDQIVTPPFRMSGIGEERLANIDMLRGVACLLVVYMHSVLWITSNETMPASLDGGFLQQSITLVDPGKIGVLVFFVISGFVVPFSLQRRRRSVARDFIVNRMFRIAPAFWFSLLVGAPIMAHFLGHEITTRNLLGNAVLLPQAVSADWVIKVYWSLQVEAVFYAICLGLYLLGWIARPLMPSCIGLGLLAIAALMAVCRDVLAVPIPVGLALFLSLMMWGFAARVAAVSEHDTATRAFRLFTVCLFLSLPLVCFVAYHRVPSHYGTWDAFALSYLIAVAIFYVFGVLSTISIRALTWVGRISYSVYLLHVPCIVVMGAMAPTVLATLPALAVIAAFSLASIAVSWVTYRCIEWPMVRQGRTLNRFLDGMGGPRSWTAKLGWMRSLTLAQSQQSCHRPPSKLIRGRRCGRPCRARSDRRG